MDRDHPVISPAARDHPRWINEKFGPAAGNERISRWQKPKKEEGRPERDGPPKVATDSWERTMLKMARPRQPITLSASSTSSGRNYPARNLAVSGIKYPARVLAIARGMMCHQRNHHPVAVTVIAAVIKPVLDGQHAVVLTNPVCQLRSPTELATSMHGA